MATTVYTNNQYYADIAAAIRNKNGSNTQYKPSDMAGAINALIVSGSAPRLQAKTVTPTTAQQIVKYDSGYNGLSQVTVNAINPVKVANDITVSGATVSIPAGYYGSNVSKSVATGSAGTPTASKGTVSNNTVTITPSVTNTTGYITGGTKTGTAVTISASELVSGTLSITTNGTQNVSNYASVNVNVPTGSNITINNQNKTVTPSTSQQIVSADSGYTGLGTVTVNAIQTDTKSVTPSTSQQTVTPDTGKYLTSVTVGAIQTETKTITPSTATQNATPSSGKYLSKVTVNPIPSNYIVPSGNKSITANGTGIDVTSYATVSVNVSGGGGITPTGDLPITINGTYDVTNYASATVNVPIQDQWVVLASGNLHDTSEDVANTYISGSTETAYNGWTSTGYIPVKPNTYYLVKNGPGNNYNAFYTSSKTSAKGGVTIPNTSNAGGYVFIKTTSTTYYIRMSGASSGVANYQIYEAAIRMPTGNINITSNGTTNISQYETVTVNVPTGSAVNNQSSKEATPSDSQQIITPDTGYTGLDQVIVKPIPSNYIIPSGNKSITSNGTNIDVKEYATVSVAVPATIPNLQKKTGITPTTASQTITADSGHDGLESVQINAMPTMTLPTSVSSSATSGFASKATISRSTSDQYINIPTGYNSAGGYYKISATPNMTLPTAAASSSSGTSKATITPTTANRYINIPTGYNGTASYYTISGDADLVAGNIKSGVQIFGVTGTYTGEAVANGSVTAPSSISGTSATVSTGTNTLTLTKTISVTPNVTTAGYISSGTAGNSSVSLTASVTTKAATTYNASTSAQTIAAGTYLTGAQTIRAVTHTATAAKIAAGQTITIGDSGSATRIANISGTFTSDATAAAADIVSGEIAYVNGSKVTGSLVIQKYYTGNSAPSSSLGNNGDIYIQQ